MEYLDRAQQAAQNTGAGGPAAGATSPPPDAPPGAGGYPDDFNPCGVYYDCDENGNPISGGGLELNPEESAKAKVLIGNSMDWIFGDGYEHIVESLKQSPDIAQAVGAEVARTIIEQGKFAEAAENPLPQSILLDAGRILVEQMFEIADREGIYKAQDETEEQTKMQEAAMYGVDVFVADQGENIDQGMRQQLGQDLRSGKYDHMALGAGVANG